MSLSGLAHWLQARSALVQLRLGMSHPTLLYVEDDSSDVLLMRRAWTKAGLVNPLQVVDDGEEAQRYLSGQGRYASRIDHPMPRLVLVDLKMPRLSGLDVLIWIRAQPAL